MTTAQAGRPRISAIVPAWNAAALLPRCLGAIRNSGLPVDEIVLFDDGSTDDTGAVAATFGARVIRNDGAPLGPGEGRNRALAAAECDLAVFIDADVVVGPDAIERLASVFADPAVTAAFGSYDDRPPAPRFSSQYANLRHHYVHQQAPSVTTTFWSGLGMVRRADFLAVGGFDRTFDLPSIEDIELGARLTARGGIIRVVPDAQASHLKDWTIRQLWRTDIHCRAIPWSKLIASGRSTGADLNGSGREKVAAILAWMVLLGLLAVPLSGWSLVVAGLAGLAYVLHNRAFFGFLARKLHGLRLVGAVALHWAYHLYASAIFGTILITTRLRPKAA